ncbi:K(+)-transporting ATPase subunit C [Alicyclobacillus mengziensis]|uniref:Potassium-transporting ATPase KdpC subunit n=1 Tax=Alicyclobacillus mengziensis TaxID=2931921 RepID=A0A9X7Z8R7_9BACL|nr:K(+)-transporting ATPase subunit C [Alicyclobacillus mengziensis]QSO48648.1 K(+)-transporting ATPase subunit C [Alicyclobacillus mengziensis]
MRSVWQSIRTTIVFMVVCGLIYPLLMVVIGQIAFPFQANGELVKGPMGTVVGSRLIAQPVTHPGLFQPRPSAVNYAGNGSGGSNLGPTNPALIKEVKGNISTFEKLNPGISVSQIGPSEVESSASGLDPDITVHDALLQIPSISKVSGLSTSELKQLVLSHVKGRFLGIWGEPHINVMDLNLALLKLEGK